MAGHPVFRFYSFAGKELAEGKSAKSGQNHV
jgi:hypothetical protein